jgi:hypothetical protein
MECFRDSVQTTIKDQTNGGDQNLSQPVAYGGTQWVYLSRKEIMLFMSHGGRRLKLRPHLRITRCDNGTEGFMGKSQKGHGTVENTTGLLDHNRERDTTLYKKLKSKQQRGVSPFPGTFNTPRNLPRQLFREQDEIGWSGLFK